MTLTKAIIITGSLFALGILMQNAAQTPATSFETMKLVDYGYVTCYVLGILFIPISVGVSNLIKKLKEK